MGRIGKSLAIAAITMDRDWLNDTVNAHYKHVTSLVAKRLADDASRPAFNLAVVLTGLEFMRRTIGRVFGTRFDERFEELTNLDPRQRHGLDPVEHVRSQPRTRHAGSPSAETRTTRWSCSTAGTTSQRGAYRDQAAQCLRERYVRYQKSGSGGAVRQLQRFPDSHAQLRWHDRTVLARTVRSTTHPAQWWSSSAALSGSGKCQSFKE